MLFLPLSYMGCGKEISRREGLWEESQLREVRSRVAVMPEVWSGALSKWGVGQR